MKRIKELISAVFFGAAVALIIYAASQTVAYRLFLDIQNKIDDSHFKRRFMIKGNNNPETDNIVIVDIDDSSIDALGRFKYWPREHFGRVIGALSRGGARLTFLDVILMDGGFYMDNRALADSLKSSGNVISGYYFNLDAPSIRQRPQDPVFNDRLSSGVLYPESVNGNNFIKAEQIVFPYTGLVVSVKGMGFTNYIPDPDDIVRHIPLYISYGKMLYPSASLQLWMYLRDLRFSKVHISSKGIQLGDTEIPTDRHCFMRINFTGTRQVFETISFIDVLNGDFEPGMFTGKVVMIGSGSEELRDLKRVPGFGALPGVEIHANALATLLSGQFLRVSSGNAVFAVTVLCGIFSSVLFSFFPMFRVGLPVVIGIPLALYFISVYSFVVNSKLLNISLPSFVIFLLYLVIMVYRLVDEYEKRKYSHEQIESESVVNQYTLPESQNE